MKWKLALICVATMSLGVAGAGDEQKKEFDRLAGAWTVDGLQYDGVEHKLKFKIVFKGNEGKVEGNAAVTDQYGGIKFMLDPKTSPKNIDVTVAAGSQTDAKMKGIYEVKDDELRICVKVFGTDRPKEFEAADGSSTVLMVLKRAPK